MNRSRHPLALSAGLAAWLALAGTAVAVPVISGDKDVWKQNPTVGITNAEITATTFTYSAPGAIPAGGTEPYPGSLAFGGSATGAYTLTVTDDTDSTTDTATIKVDKANPLISGPALTPAPGPGAAVQFGSLVQVGYGCTDEHSGVAPANCVGNVPAGGNVPTNSLGPKAVNVTATDNAGNQQPASVGYNVVDTIPPSVPVPLGPSGSTPDTTPTFTWQLSTDPGGSGVKNYLVVVKNAAGVTVFSKTSTDGNETPTNPLPNGAYTWTVKATDNGGAASASSAPMSFTIDPNAPASPVLNDGPSGMTNEVRPRFGWTGASGATFSWALKLNGVVVASANTTTPAVTVGPLGDSAGYVFEVAQTAPNGLLSQPAQRAFTLDTVAPGPTTLARKPKATSSVPTPTFGWLGGGEPGGVFRWRVLNAKDEVVQGPTGTTGSEVQLKPLAAGTYRFIVNVVDAAGNQSAGTTPYVFRITEPAAPKPNINAATPATRNARLLAPKPATKLRVARPRLSWKTSCKGVVLYNVQLFRLNGRNLTKVHSAFPKAKSYRVPPNIVRAGVRYVWQLWCWRGPKLGYQAKPLGITYFDQMTSPKPNRLLAPAGKTHAIGKPLVVRWRPAPKTSGYQVVLFRGTVQVGRKATTGKKLTFPGTLLSRDATYRVVIRRAVAPGKYSKSAWAGTTFRVPPAT